MSIDEDRPTFTSPFSPKHCFIKNLNSGSHFQLPYDLWWQFVYQKNFTCRNPSTNYKRIRNNIYVDSANKMASAPGCQPCACKTSPSGSTCGENCLNRVMFTECTPGVCPCGENCSNRRFQKRQWAPALDKFWTGTGKGFGVRTNEVIKNGSFICEYLGEVVNWETFAERTRTWYRDCDRHYALNLDSGWVIDGYRSGSVARFINHSCQPNCEVQKWVVNGQYRMGIFAVVDIQAGQELTYNYNFQSFSRTGPEKCLCRSEKCSGAVGLSWPNRRGRPSFLLRNYRKILGRKSRNIGAKKNPIKMDFLRQFLLEKCRLSAKFRNFNDETILKGFSLNIPENCTQFNPNFVDILQKILSNRPADNLMQQLTKYLLDLYYSKNEDSPLLEKIYQDSRPLVGEYDPDRVNLDLDLWSKNRTPDTDKVRCLCGSFEDDGEMVQCDACFYWLHSDCLKLKSSNFSSGGGLDENFACNFCRAIDSTKNESRDVMEKCIRKQFCDIILEPQPDFKLPKCTYYKALMCGDLQIRLGDCVYLRRDVSEIQKRLLNDLNEECVVKHSKNSRQIKSHESNFIHELLIKKNQTFLRKDLRIMRVERLFMGPRNVRFMFGSYFAHHYETFCEPNRRFYKNEVFVTPLYDTWPLVSSVVGRCLVLDPATYCKGRPLFPAYDERDVFVCEYRVDKSQRLFDKSSSTKCGGRLQVNCQSFIFRNFENKLKICRNFTPFDDQLRNKNKTKIAATKIALSNEQIEKLSKFGKRIRLDQQIARIKNM
uniref:Histone-lysine N-methyltransferase n=1 Tax=Romanomermis culicivorax TaxID=13658 RepID=A0A915KGG2_ROMCU